MVTDDSTVVREMDTEDGKVRVSIDRSDMIIRGADGNSIIVNADRIADFINMISDAYNDQQEIYIHPKGAEA